MVSLDYCEQRKRL